MNKLSLKFDRADKSFMPSMTCRPSVVKVGPKKAKQFEVVSNRIEDLIKEFRIAMVPNSWTLDTTG